MKKSNFIYFLVFLINILFSNTSIAQSTYYLSKYNKANTNFSYNIITDLLIDSNNQLWIATPSILVNFNGIDFTNINIPNKNRIISIQRNGDNKNTILFSDGNIYEFNNTSHLFKLIHTNKKHKGFDYNYKFIIADYELFKKLINDTLKLQYYNHKLIYEKSTNSCLYYTKNIFVRIYHTRLKDTILAVNVNQYPKTLIHNNQFLLQNKQLQLSPLSFHYTINPPINLNPNQHFYYIDKYNQPLTLIQGKNIWILTNTNEKFRWQLIYNDLPTNTLFSSIAFSTNFNTIYLGSQSEGLLVLRKHEFACNHVPIEVAKENYYLQVPLRSNEILTNGNIIISPKNDYKIGNLKKFNLGNNQFCINDTISLISEQEYVLLFNKLNQNYKIVKSGKTSSYTSFLRLKNHKILIVQTDSIFVFNPSNLQCQFIAQNYSYLNINKIIEISPNILWISSCSGLDIIDIKHNLHRKNLLPNNCIRDILQSPSGIVVSTYGTGLFLINPNNYHVTPFPLDYYQSLLHAHSFYIDPVDRIWISTNTGLLVFPVEHFLKSAGKKEFISQPSYFTTWNGLPTDEFNGGCAPAFLNFNDTLLSYPTIKGFIKFNPYTINTNYIIHDFQINSIKTTDTGFLKIKNNSIEIPYNTDIIKLDLKLVCDYNPKSLQLYYSYQGKTNYTPYLNLNNLEISISHYNLDSIVFFSYYNNKKFKLYTLYVFREKFWLLKPLNWIYLSFILIAFIIAITRINSYRIKQKNHKLQELINEKTTELNLVNKELQSKISSLTLSNDANQFYISVINHDIYAPIKFINIIGDQIFSNPSKIKKQEIIDNFNLIINATKRLQILCSNILNHINSESVENSELSDFNLHELINELHQFLGIGIGIQKNVLNNLISPDISLNINKDALTVILTNLISNSNRFSKNGEISILYQLAESCHLISVSDTGIGMDIQLMEHINQRNLQITNRNSITHKSYGIGYNLIFKMLEVLNADLVVFRNQPFGTVVQISIPTTPNVG